MVRTTKPIPSPKLNVHPSAFPSAFPKPTETAHIGMPPDVYKKMGHIAQKELVQLPLPPTIYREMTLSGPPQITVAKDVYNTLTKVYNFSI